MFLQNVSKFIHNYLYEQASFESINTIKAAFLDFYGVTYRGMDEKVVKIAFNTLEEIFSKNSNPELKASIINSDVKTNILNAAFINSIAAHALDLDDGHRLAQIHLGSIIFPTALAISESYDLTGIEFLESVLVGYEVGILLGQIVNPKHRNKGFHTTGTIGTFVSGSVAAKLLKLNENQILNTLGLCGTQSAGLLESNHTGSMAKALHVGKATYNGILSAFLAKNGFTGSNTIFEGREGFINTMVLSENNDSSFENIIKNIGNINIRTIYFKKYPFCRHLHSSIDTALKLKASIGDDYDHIEKITLETYKIASQHNNYNPKTPEELKQSLPYAVAIALVMGDVNIDIINNLIKKGLLDIYSTDDIIISIKNMANNMNILCDDKLESLYPDKRPSNIIIKLDKNFRNGVFQNLTKLPKGDFENPLHLRDLIDKFKQLNPEYDIDNLTIIDSVEDHYMKDVVYKLND